MKYSVNAFFNIILSQSKLGGEKGLSVWKSLNFHYLVQKLSKDVLPLHINKTILEREIVH
jgi:hypothetical protein